MDKIYEFEELKEHLKNHKFEEKPIFRGENKYYPTCLPSLERFEGELKYAFNAILLNLCSFIAEERIWKNVNNTAGLITREGQPFGAINLLDHTDPEPKNTIYGLQGILQHYGFPTHWFDFSYDYNTALYFASCESDSKIGYLYYLDKYRCDLGQLIDLSDFIKQLRPIIEVPTVRPETQNALALRIYDLKKLDLRNELKVFKFKKPNISNDAHDYYFPRDGLSTWLNGMLIDYYHQVRKSLKVLIQEKDSHYTDYKKYSKLIKLAIDNLKLR